MSSSEVAGCLATVSAAFTALLVLGHNGTWRLSYALTAFVATAAVGQALILAWPEVFWTPELYAAWDAGLALLAAVAGLELGRGVLRPAMKTWAWVCGRAALVLVPLAAIGTFGLLSAAGSQRVGYRGQLVVDASVAAVLALVLGAVSLYELPRHPAAVTALRGLGCYYTVQVIYLGSWEWSQGAAHLAGWAAIAVFVWAMLTIARDAGGQAGTSLRFPARASR